MVEKPESHSGSSGRKSRENEKGASSVTARREDSSPECEQLVEAVVERGNMRTALQRVMSNRGAAGVDGMAVEELKPYLREEWKRIREELLAGEYRPRPVLKVEIPKADGKGVRKLGIPRVVS
jgi:retron-type reverse transcriptase